MGFGGYLGLFIGASILSLYDVSINFFMKIVTKYKHRLDSKIKTEELKLEIEEHDNEGQLEKTLNLAPSKKVPTTPQSFSSGEMELENSQILMKQGKTIKKLEKLLAKQANILAKLEKRNKKYEDGNSFRKEVRK